MKLAIKKLGISLAKLVGPSIPTVIARSFLCDRVVPYLMDERLLPRGPIARPTRHFGVSVLCDPYVYVHRKGYWCGVFFEEGLENYLLRNIQRGDTVIDVGMNVGHVTLLAGARVGTTGKVLAFEPNKALVDKVAVLAALQELIQIHILPYGLSEKEGTFILRMEPEHAGGATFRSSVSDEFTVTQECETRVGDEVLSGERLPGRAFLKVDVEGLEVEVLRGMRETLRRVDHAVIEVSPDWLGTVGVTELFGVMRAAGLYPYELTDKGCAGGKLDPEDVNSQINVLFLR
jgi:FkbM family methyltransferase